MEQTERSGKLRWFPGHMKNALDDIEESKVKLIDACWIPALRFRV